MLEHIDLADQLPDRWVPIGKAFAQSPKLVLFFLDLLKR